MVVDSLIANGQSLAVHLCNRGSFARLLGDSLSDVVETCGKISDPILNEVGIPSGELVN